MHDIVFQIDSYLVKTEKRRIYLAPGEQFPSGVSVQRGSRGGLYYEVGAKQHKKKVTPQHKLLQEKWYGTSKQEILAQKEYKTLEERKQALLAKVPPMYRDSAVINDEVLYGKNNKIFTTKAKWLVKWTSISPKTGKSKQQIAYSLNWLDETSREKWNQMKILAKHLPQIRDMATKMMQNYKDGNKAIGAIVSLLDSTAFRIGGENYAKDFGTFGLSSLLNKHLKLYKNNVVELNFVGKKGVLFEKQRFTVSDSLYQTLAHFKQNTKADDKLFPINEYSIRQTLSHFRVRPKDFRTFHANRMLIEELLSGPQYKGDMKKRENRIVEAIKVVANKLGHGWTVSRNSYLHPAIIQAYLDGHDFSEEQEIFAKQIEKLTPQEEEFINHLETIHFI